MGNRQVVFALTYHHPNKNVVEWFSISLRKRIMLLFFLENLPFISDVTQTETLRNWYRKVTCNESQPAERAPNKLSK